jgi:hypothetical protein
VLRPVRGDREPPADPRSIELTYQHRQSLWHDADEELQTWHVSADIHDDRGEVVVHVGDIMIVLVDVYEAGDPAGTPRRRGRRPGPYRQRSLRRQR